MERLTIPARFSLEASCEMGRHKSSLRELGWSAGNSPNPWKQGSAKRVVRALDYSSVECDYAKDVVSVSEEVPIADRAWEDRLQQLQHDGAHPLHNDGIITAFATPVHPLSLRLTYAPPMDTIPFIGSCLDQLRVGKFTVITA